WRRWRRRAVYGCAWSERGCGDGLTHVEAAVWATPLPWLHGPLRRPEVPVPRLLVPVRQIPQERREPGVLVVRAPQQRQGVERGRAADGDLPQLDVGGAG